VIERLGSHGRDAYKVSGSLTCQQAHKRDQQICRLRLVILDRCRTALAHDGPSMSSRQSGVEMAKSFSVFVRSVLQDRTHPTAPRILGKFDVEWLASGLEETNERARRYPLIGAVWRPD